jgi:hypothetical protein
MPSKTKKYRKKEFRKTAKGGRKNESINTDLEKKKLVMVLENNAKSNDEKRLLNGVRRVFIRKYIKGFTLKKWRRKLSVVGYGITIDTPLDELPYKLVKEIARIFLEELKLKKEADKIVNSMTKTIKKESSKLNTLRSKMKTIEENIVEPDTLYDKYKNDLKHSKNADTIVKAALGMSIYDTKRRNKTVKTKSS